MDHNDLNISTIMKTIEEKRSELNAIIEMNDIDENITPADEVLQKSRELDELINIVQIKINERMF